MKRGFLQTKEKKVAPHAQRAGRADLPSYSQFSSRLLAYSQKIPSMVNQGLFIGVCLQSATQRNDAHLVFDTGMEKIYDVISTAPHPNAHVAGITGADAELTDHVRGVRAFWCRACVLSYNTYIAKPSWHGTVESDAWYKVARVLQMREQLPFPIEVCYMIYQYLLPSVRRLAELKYSTVTGCFCRGFKKKL